jgi:hypothetical protein
MEIPTKFLDEFKRIYKKDYGEELSDGEAREMAISLARMFHILSKPPNREKHTKDYA